MTPIANSPQDAYDRLEVFESTAEALINARPVGVICPWRMDIFSTC